MASAFHYRQEQEPESGKYFRTADMYIKNIQADCVFENATC